VRTIKQSTATIAIRIRLIWPNPKVWDTGSNSRHGGTSTDVAANAPM